MVWNVCPKNYPAIHVAFTWMYRVYNRFSKPHDRKYYKMLQFFAGVKHIKSGPALPFNHNTLFLVVSELLKWPRMSQMIPIFFSIYDIFICLDWIGGGAWGRGCGGGRWVFYCCSTVTHPQFVIIVVKKESTVFSVLCKRFVTLKYQTLFIFCSLFAVTAHRGGRGREIEAGGASKRKSRCKAGSASPNWGEGITTDNGGKVGHNKQQGRPVKTPLECV